MALDSRIRAQLTLPVICSPMFLVTGPALVREACKAGVIGGLPRPNASSVEEFDAWLTEIRRDLNQWSENQPHARVAPMAVNLSTRMPLDELKANLEVCRRHGVEIIVSAAGDPTELIRRVHDWGGKVFHDVTSLRFAEKAAAAGADGLTCIGSGGGGHSGTISHLALIPQIRSFYDGTLVLAGAVSTGAVVRAAEILGADLAYMGTRFIATQESDAPQAYKDLLVSQTSSNLMFTDRIAHVPANWIMESMRLVGLDPADLPHPVKGEDRYSHLPEAARPWKSIWSAGQGIDLIHDIPSVAELVSRLRREYLTACETPNMIEAARLAEEALDRAPA